MDKPTRRIRIRRASAALVTLVVAGTAQAGQQAPRIACVHDEAEFTAALAAAQDNNVDGISDEIRLHVGHYDATLAGPNGWHIDLGDGTTSLAVLGGYTDADCVQRSMDPALTVLDGTSADGTLSVRPLTIDGSAGGVGTAAAVVISGLTFEDGRGEAAGGLKISDAGPIFGGTITVERNIFRRNIATRQLDENFFQFDGAPGALYAATDGPTGDRGGLGLIVRDNLFEGNSGTNPAALFLFSNNEIAVTNNTFVGNNATQASLPERHVFHSVSFWNVEVSSNLFFANTPDGVLDLRALTSFFPGPGERPITNLYDNVLQNIAGAPAHVEGTIAGDPGFIAIDAGDYRLAANSPAVDTGRADPLGGIGSHDAGGQARSSGAGVDRGAFERQPDTMLMRIFLDGFE
jgi:hypothetical protein